MVTNPHRLLATNPANLRILLQMTSNQITSWPPIDLHLVFSQLPPNCLLTSCSTSCRSTSLTCYWLLWIQIFMVEHFDLQISLPFDRPRLDFHCKEYNNPIVWLWYEFYEGSVESIQNYPKVYWGLHYPSKILFNEIITTKKNFDRENNRA
jgi:hypothetical protein